MSVREIAVLSVSAALIAMGAVCGYRLLQFKNHLLGCEWFILAISSACGALFIVGHVPLAGSLVHFFDLFSRLFGVPLIAGIGLLRVTHDYETSKRVEYLVCAGSLLISALLFGHSKFADFSEAILAAETMAYVAFSLLMVLLTYQCFQYRLMGHGLAMVGAIAFNVWVATFGDILELAPHDHMPGRVDEFVLTHLSWTFAFGELYLVYVALADAKGIALTYPFRASRPS